MSGVIFVVGSLLALFPAAVFRLVDFRPAARAVVFGAARFLAPFLAAPERFETAFFKASPPIAALPPRTDALTALTASRCPAMSKSERLFPAANASLSH